MRKSFMKRIIAVCLVLLMLPVNSILANAAVGTDSELESAFAKSKTYIDGLTINNASNDPAKVVSNFKTHFTWDNEKRENSKSYLFDWSYYNGVVFEGLEYLYEVTGEEVYKDYVVEYMSSLIASNGTWAMCSNNTSKQCAGYNSTHGADCYKTASLLLDAYEMTNDSRYLTMAKTLYADLDSAANEYSLKNAGNNYRHTWASDPSPDLWLDGLYMILPFRAEYAAYINDTEELDLIVDRMQWVSDNMYNKSKGLFYHAADNANSNSGTFWLRSIGWYAAAIVDIMDSMEGDNLEAMKSQLVKLVDGMKAVQNSSNGMWLNNMNASQSSTNPYETSGTALVCYAIMKAVNEGWLDESYADMAVLSFKGICNEKLSGSTLKDICFKGAPGSSNSTFYDNEGKGVGPFIMFYAEMLEYANKAEEHVHEWIVTEEVEATCETAGSVTETCTGCGETVTEVIPAIGHNYKTVTVEATCEADGSVTTTCANCGDTVVEVIKAFGHNYEYVEVDPTCENAGYTSYECVHCGDGEREELPALGHKYESVTTEATCTTNGQTIHTCTTCGDTYTTDFVAAFGHTYETVTVEPTCTDKGSVTHTCVTCGKKTIDVLEAIGHSYTSVETNNAITYTCEHCGDSYSESLVVEYAYNKVTAFESKNNYVITLYSGRKYYAVTHVNNKLGVTQITVSGNQITSEITEDMLWTYEGSKLSYKDGNTTYYLYAGSTGNGGWWGNWWSTPTLSVSTSNSSTVSLSSNKLKIDSNYLRYTNGSVTLNRSATTTYIYKQTKK